MIGFFSAPLRDDTLSLFTSITKSRPYHRYCIFGLRVKHVFAPYAVECARNMPESGKLWAARELSSKRLNLPSGGK